METKKILTFLFLVLLFGRNAYSVESLTYHLHGGAIFSYASDRIIIDDQGNLALTTLSPTFAETPNRIGKFHTQISKNELETLNAIIKENSKNIKSPKHQPQASQLIEELHIGNKKIYWSSHQNSASISTIRKEFLKLAKKAYKNPINALSLKCQQNNKLIKCSYLNISKELVTTVDPLGVNYSIGCKDIRGKTRILHELKEFNPKKMNPKIIKIKPNENYSFKLLSKYQCDYRIVVKTTDMLIHPNYTNILLGELVSNQLKN